MRKLGLTVVALAGLTAACASVAPPPVPVPAAAVAVAAVPPPTPGHDWFLSQDQGTARLAYGVEASDDLKLGLDCAAGTGKIDLVALGKTGTDEIHLESGGETARFAAEAEPSQLHDGDLLTATVEADTPVLQRFRRLGWIAQWVDGQRAAYAPQPGSQINVERFFALCD
jgi:opacity protein-like surface antigen